MAKLPGYIKAINLEKNWTCGKDFLDDSSRYTFEGRDPSYTLSRVYVVIWIEMVKPYPGADYREKRYFGSVYDNKLEAEYFDNRKPYRYLKEIKWEIEKVFDELSVTILK